MFKTITGKEYKEIRSVSNTKKEIGLKIAKLEDEIRELKLQLGETTKVAEPRGHIKGELPEEVKHIISLPVGDAIVFTKKDWKRSSKPDNYLRFYAYRKGLFSFKTKTLGDKSGWAVLRTK